MSEPDAATEAQLQECRGQRIRDRDIGSGYACTTDGCDAEDGHGFAWTDAAREWACTNQRPDLCEE